MLKKNRIPIILSSIVTLLPAVAGLLIWNMLPDKMTTHWNIAGQADGFSGKAFAVFGVPVISLISQWLGILVTVHDRKNEEQSRKVLSMVLWIVPIVSILAECGIYAVALGADVGVELLVKVPLGLMFLVMGNYMPKCKPNRTIGVRVKWTLGNEENWVKTHRFTGRLWVAGGVFILAMMLMPLERYMGVFFVVILFLALAPELYSYLYYRRQLREGTAVREAAKEKQTSWEKKFTRVSLIIGAVITVLVVLLLVSGDIKVQYKEETFRVDALYWEDAEISYADIDNIEYREQDAPGSRTFGFGSFKLLMGSFKNEEFGKYTRYSYIKCPSCIVLTVKGEVLVLNGEDEEATRDIYEELSKRIQF